MGCKAFESVNPFVMIAHVFLHLLSPLARLLLLSALAAAAGIVMAVNLREYLYLPALRTAVGIVRESLI